jgi:hypothetical protein
VIPKAIKAKQPPGTKAKAIGHLHAKKALVPQTSATMARKLGGTPATKAGRLLAQKFPAKPTQTVTGVPPATTIKKPAALGPQAQKQVTHAESAASRVNANQRSIIGITRSVFPALYGDDGRPRQVPGMRRQKIQQRMLNPYKASFTFGNPKF